MSTDLLRFEFSSPLTRPQIEALKAATGMRISDTGNPYKDTPGKGRVAGNVQIFLGRDKRENTWHISAFSPEVRGADLQAVAVLRQRLRDVLPTIATEWKDASTDAARREIEVELHVRGTDAHGTYIGPALIVSAGSRGTTRATEAFQRNHRYADTLRHLEDIGVIRVEGDSFVFLQDHTFPSATAAAHLLTGAATPGPARWRLTGTNEPLRDALRRAS